MPRARPVGSGSDIGNCGEERVLPEIVGLPPGDFTEQVRFGAAVQRRGRQHRVLELAPVPAPPGVLGQEPLPHPFQRQRIGRAGPGPGERVGGQPEEDLAGKGVVARVQRLQLAEQVRQRGVLGEAGEQDAPGGDRVLGCG